MTLLELAAVAPAVELSWSGPEGCPSEREIRAMLDQALAGATASETVRASATVERTESGEYSAELVVEMGERRSERTLTATECSALAEATAIVVAVAVDPTQALDAARVPEPRPPEPAPVPEPAATAIDPTADPAITTIARDDVDSTPPASTPPPRKSRIDGVHLRGFGAVEYGALPGVDGSIGLAVGAHGRWFRFEGAGSWAFAREASAPGQPLARARIAMWSLAARGCGVPAVGRVEFPLCAAVEAGALEGRGIDPTRNQQRERRAWVAASAGPALAWVPIPRLALLVGVDLVVPMYRARFLIGDLEVHRPLPVGVRAGAGIELRLGVRP